MTSKPPRQAKTPRQRAEDQLGVAQRRVDALTKQRAKAQGALNRIVHDLEEAQARLDYVKQDPALPARTPDTSSPGGTTP